MTESGEDYIKRKHIDEILAELRELISKEKPESLPDFVVEKIAGLDTKFNPMVRAPVRRTRRRNVFAPASRTIVFTQLPPRVVHKEEERELILRALRSNSLTFELPLEVLEEVESYMEKKSYPEGTTIVREGEPGDFFYIIYTGHCAVLRSVTNPDGTEEEKQVNTQGPGITFGELALMYDSPRRATVKALEDTVCFRLHGDYYRLIVKKTTEEKIDRYSKLLVKVPLMQNLTREEISIVASAVRMQRYDRGSNIIKQGDVGDSFYLITRGTCDVVVNDRIVASLHERQTFGEAALLTAEPRNATIRVSSDVAECIIVDRQTFLSIIGPVANLVERRAGSIASSSALSKKESSPGPSPRKPATVAAGSSPREASSRSGDNATA